MQNKLGKRNLYFIAYELIYLCRLFTYSADLIWNSIINKSFILTNWFVSSLEDRWVFFMRIFQRVFLVENSLRWSFLGTILVDAQIFTKASWWDPKLYQNASQKLKRYFKILFMLNHRMKHTQILRKLFKSFTFN